MIPASHYSWYLYKLAIDHEVNQFIDVFFFVCNDFQFRNLSVRENICHRNILRKFRFQIQSVAFSCYKFYFSFATVYYFKNLSMFVIFCTFMMYTPFLFYLFLSFTPSIYTIFFENQGFFLNQRFGHCEQFNSLFLCIITMSISKQYCPYGSRSYALYTDVRLHA